jgi:hypothetical protein
MNRVSNPYELPRLRKAASLCALILIILGGFAGFSSLNFSSVDSSYLLTVFTKFLLISIFIERGLEFFIALWRGGHTKYLGHLVEETQRKVDKLETGGNGMKSELKKDLENLRKQKRDLQQYKAETTRLALWASFLFGLLMSITGVRFLQFMVEIPEHMKSNNHIQVCLFYCVDILVTACLISGGSEGFHKIMALYNRFMDTSTLRLKDSSKSSEMLNKASPQ